MTDKSDLLFTIGSGELARGLRPSKRMPRNSKFLTTCQGVVGRDGVLSALDELSRFTTVYTLNFDAQTGSFTVGNTVTGATSGAAGVVTSVSQNGGTGYLVLSGVSGTFQDDEIIYESALGSELIPNADMELDANWIDFGTPATRERSNEQAHGGTYSQKFIPNAQYEGVASGAITGQTVGNFYRTQVWIYGDRTNKAALRIGTAGNYFTPSISDGLNGYVFPASWTQTVWYFQAVAIAVDHQVYSGIGVTTGTWYTDDASLKQITNAALCNGVATNTFTFPYPQIFVFTNVIIVCSATHIYEWVFGALVHKLTVATGSTWTAIDFFDYIYLSNGTVTVERNALDKTYSTTTSLPTAMAACNFNGQVILGSPDAGYET